MYCKHCGREIDDNSSYCKYCGKPQDNRVSTPNSFIDFVYKKPILSSYILWVIINTVCLSSGKKCGEYYNLLFPKFCLEDYYYENSSSNVFNLGNYQITDFIVYTILIPLVIFLGYHYFKKVKSVKYRIFWGLWFMFNILWYNWSNVNLWHNWSNVNFNYEELDDCFFPFTQQYGYSLFCYHAYDLSELVVYTMIIPIAYWGYLYYKDKKKGIKDIK